MERQSHCFHIAAEERQARCHPPRARTCTAFLDGSPGRRTPAWTNPPWPAEVDGPMVRSGQEAPGQSLPAQDALKSHALMGSVPFIPPTPPLVLKLIASSAEATSGFGRLREVQESQFGFPFPTSWHCISSRTPTAGFPLPALSKQTLEPRFEWQKAQGLSLKMRLGSGVCHGTERGVPAHPARAAGEASPRPSVVQSRAHVSLTTSHTPCPLRRKELAAFVSMNGLEKRSDCPT